MAAGPRRSTLAGRAASDDASFSTARPEPRSPKNSPSHRDGQVFGDERTTVEQFLRAWLRSVEASVGPRTWIRYEELIRLHAVPHIGRVRLTRLGARQLDQLYGELVRAGLSPTTVVQLHRILHHALRDAMRWNLVARNATELVTPPRKAHHDFVTFTPDQARCFLEAVRGDRLEALYILALTTGMREGELFGLRWVDVNLAAGALHLVKQLKTRSSRRQVLLVSVAVDALGRHLVRQREERLLLGLGGTTTGWSSRTPWVSPCTPPTSCSGVSIRCWRGLGSRGFASTTCATVPLRCCLASASTPRS
jgi:integrase